MNFYLNDEIIKHIDNSVDEAKELLKELCLIPAPSNKEEQRAEFCKNWLLNNGADGAYTDSALNVIYPLNCDGNDDIVVFMAHTDTVFPDLTYPMPYSEDDKNIYSPGVGDDTLCLVMMLMAVKYIVKNKIQPKCGILFVANSGEEGLGNLKGSRKIMEDFGDRVKEFYTFDGMYNHLVNRCVGSHRYKINVETEGGHSFGNFGNKNSIAVMSKLINSLYSIEVPAVEGTKTTYNVGVIEGGTSVNTIAQSCSMMYEYRSDDKACMDFMEAEFKKAVKALEDENICKLSVELIGERPCGGDVDQKRLAKMSERCMEICEKYTGIKCHAESGSTDCNIPQSMGIPAVCPGTYFGGGVHTREEWAEKASIPKGLKITFEIILDYFKL